MNTLVKAFSNGRVEVRQEDDYHFYVSFGGGKRSINFCIFDNGNQIVLTSSAAMEICTYEDAAGVAEPAISFSVPLVLRED